MKKIRLNLADLKVESFVTSDAGREGEGTVFAIGNTVCQATCDWQATCHGGPCDDSHPSDCCDYTNPDLQSCTGEHEVTDQPGCDTGDCPTEFDCSEEITVCCGPTD